MSTWTRFPDVPRSIDIFAVWEKADGTPSRLVDDKRGLGDSNWKWLVKRLHARSDDDIRFGCERIPGWGRGADGEWVVLEAGPFFCVCELDLGKPELVRLKLA